MKEWTPAFAGVTTIGIFLVERASLPV